MMKISFNLPDYSPVDAGERVLEITKAECKPSGKPTEMNVTFRDVLTNRTLQNRYNFANNGGMAAMAFLCRTALDIPDMGEFDTVEDTPKLVGKKVKCEVVHTEGTTPKDDGTLPIFANIKRVISRIDDNTTTTSGDLSPREAISQSFDDLD